MHPHSEHVDGLPSSQGGKGARNEPTRPEPKAILSSSLTDTIQTPDTPAPSSECAGQGQAPREEASASELVQADRQTSVDLSAVPPPTNEDPWNSSFSLLQRFEQSGDLAVLQQAIAILGKLVKSTSALNEGYRTGLANLGLALLYRFNSLGELHDLEDAISRYKDAIDLIPHGHPDKSAYLNNLGNSFFTRFKRLGQLADLEEAISMLKDAVDLTPSGHSDRPVRLNNLSNYFFTRFERLGQLNDLEDAISTLRDAINLIPHGHPDKPARLYTLGNFFVARFKHSEQVSGLENAISILRDAVNLASHSYPDRLALNPQPDDLEQTISMYSHTASSPTGPVSVRFHASLNWISYARRVRHHSLLRAYSVSLSLLPELAWIGSCLAHRYSELVQAVDVVREAAAAALDSGSPETAVEWLEQGRSIVWRQSFQLRDSYEELSAAHPDYAYRLREVSIHLDQSSAAHEQSLSAPSEQNQCEAHHTAESLRRGADRYRTLAIQRDMLLQNIRRLPGFEQFLLRKQFSQLRASAHSGPVVILNAAESRCDALILLANVDHVIHVPLPDFTFNQSTELLNTLKHLTRFEMEENGASWEFLLSSLWKSVVKPVLDALYFSTPGGLSRIFWCPTGPLVFLPIHAAGLYGSQYSQPGHKVFDFVVSSYVPTLSVLLRSIPDAVPTCESLRFLAVRQPPSDGLAPIPSVAIELERIKEVINRSPLAPTTTFLESSTGTVEEVLALMRESDWVHFACHGIQDAKNPPESGLCLADGHRLRLRDLLTLSRRTNGGLAFLSVSNTAVGDEHLPDEAIHVAAGMLSAGYEGVIGAMWQIRDRIAPVVARDVYEHLFREGAKPDCWEAARALHDAAEGLRNRGAPFVEWIPFIHVGL